MLLPSSSTVFSPPPDMVFDEPDGRRGSGFSPDACSRVLPLTKPNSTTSTAELDELPVTYETEKTTSSINKERIATEISKRLQFLRIEAEIDRVAFSNASLNDFHSFMRDASPRLRPSLFLNDNGNLRAIWKNDRHEQIGLQFLGDGSIQFVIFKQRKGSTAMTSVAGVDVGDKILGHIKASGAEELLYA